MEDSVEKYGSLGLKGLWALIGNSTAMVVVAVLLFVAIFQVRSMHSEGMNLMERLYYGHGAMLERNTNAVDKCERAIETLASEIKWLRQHKSLEK